MLLRSLCLPAGYITLQCAQLVVKTGAAPPSGQLRFSVDLAPASIAADSSAPAARRRLQQVASGAACAVQLQEPLATLRFASAEDGQSVASVVWRDALNRTLASGPGLTSLRLPALQRPVAQAAASPDQGCTGADCPNPRTFYVHVLGVDGRHTQARLLLRPLASGGLEARVAYKTYEPGRLSSYEERFTVAAPCPVAPVVASPDVAPGAVVAGEAEAGGASSGMLIGLIGGAVGLAVLAAALITVLVCMVRHAKRQAASQPGEAEHKVSAVRQEEGGAQGPTDDRIGTAVAV